MAAFSFLVTRVLRVKAWTKEALKKGFPTHPRSATEEESDRSREGVFSLQPHWEEDRIKGTSDPPSPSLGPDMTLKFKWGNKRCE